MVGLKFRPPPPDEEDSGPRRLLFGSVSEVQKGKPPDPPGGSLIPANVRLHSSSIPGIFPGETYNINVTQAISYSDPKTGDQQNPALTTAQEFVVKLDPCSLNASSIHSVYPPPGHGDYSSKSDGQQIWIASLSCRSMPILISTDVQQTFYPMCC